MAGTGPAASTADRSKTCGSRHGGDSTCRKHRRLHREMWEPPWRRPDLPQAPPTAARPVGAAMAATRPAASTADRSKKCGSRHGGDSTCRKHRRLHREMWEPPWRRLDLPQAPPTAARNVGAAMAATGPAASTANCIEKCGSRHGGDWTCRKHRQLQQDLWQPPWRRLDLPQAPPTAARPVAAAMAATGPAASTADRSKTCGSRHGGDWTCRKHRRPQRQKLPLQPTPPSVTRYAYHPRSSR